MFHFSTLLNYVIVKEPYKLFDSSGESFFEFHSRLSRSIILSSLISLQENKSA